MFYVYSEEPDEGCEAEFENGVCSYEEDDMGGRLPVRCSCDDHVIIPNARYVDLSTKSQAVGISLCESEAMGVYSLLQHHAFFWSKNLDDNLTAKLKILLTRNSL